jgi:hypothetical protein
MKRLRIVAIASAGGHWVQLSRLSPLFADHDTRYVTTLEGAVAPTGAHDLVIVPDASRSEPMKLILLWFRLAKLLLSTRPQVIVTTGAAPGLIALQIGKLIRSHTIWIDSIANSEELSMSGKIAHRFADLWLTQWEHLTGADHPNLRCLGKML